MPSTKKPNHADSDAHVISIRSHFNAKEWEWIQKDENCRNVIAGRDLLATLFYLRFRTPRTLCRRLDD